MGIASRILNPSHSTDLAALKGSEKQVAWAEKERDKVVANLERRLLIDQKNLQETIEQKERDIANFGDSAKERANRSIERSQADVDLTITAIEKARSLTSSKGSGLV